MTGTSTPRSAELAQHLGDRRGGRFRVDRDRTSWEPAWASRATWIAVASASAVSVFVIDWTTIGWAQPTRTPPTSTLTVGRRRGSGASGVAIAGASGGAAAQDPEDVEAGDPDEEAEQEHEPDDVGQPLRAEADPRRRRCDFSTSISARPPSSGGNGQAVHQGEVGRQDARHVERQDRTGAEEDVADLGGDADRARDRLAAPSGWSTKSLARSPRPARISPNQRNGLVGHRCRPRAGRSRPCVPWTG